MQTEIEEERRKKNVKSDSLLLFCFLELTHMMIGERYFSIILHTFI